MFGGPYLLCLDLDDAFQLTVHWDLPSFSFFFLIGLLYKITLVLSTLFCIFSFIFLIHMNLYIIILIILTILINSPAFPGDSLIIFRIFLHFHDDANKIQTFFRFCSLNARTQNTLLSKLASSQRHSYHQIKRMAERQKEKHGWEFLFLGANIDAIATTKNFGIHSSRAANYHSDPTGTQRNCRVLGQTISCLRESQPLSPSWKEEIELDYQKRKANAR